MDSSGFLGDFNWRMQQNLVSNMILSGINDKSFISVVNFDNGAFKQWTFEDPQNKTKIIQKIQSIDFLDLVPIRATFDGFEDAMEVFQETKNANISNLLIFIADGEPFPYDWYSVCEIGDSTEDYLAIYGMYHAFGNVMVFNMYNKINFLDF